PTTPGVRQFNRAMDRFSALVIYLSLIAIEEDPILWETCKANEEDKLLLGANDFRQFGTTDAYFRLRAKHSNQNIQKCLDELAFSIKDSRMPRSLPEILGSTSGQVITIVPYSPPPLPMP